MPENIYICPICGSEYPDNDTLHEINGVYVCENCCFMCDECNNWFLNSNGNYFERYNRHYCSICSRELVTTCDHCGEDTYRSDIRSDSDGTGICERCREDYCRCVQCGIWVHYDDRYELNDEYYCENCYHENRFLHDYSYKPDPLFKGCGEVFFGVELEIDREHYDRQTLKQTANKIADIDPPEDYIYLKSDGSLSSMGIEIVTHPMTIDTHEETAIWQNIINVATSYEYKSHNTDTCGLHIHTNRNQFTEAQLCKLVYLFDHFYDDILTISRRTSSQFNNWAAKYDLENINNFDEIRHKTSHYRILNITYNTVELRMFRGTLKYESIMAAIEFYDGMIKLSNMPLELLLHMTFTDVIAWLVHEYTENKYLTPYLQSRKITIPDQYVFQQKIDDINALKAEYNNNEYYSRFCAWNNEEHIPIVRYPDMDSFAMCKIEEYIQIYTAYHSIIS